MSGIKNKIVLLVAAGVLSACTNVIVTPDPSPPGIPADLQDQLDKTTTSNTTSANNALVQSRILYAQLVSRWNDISPIDTGAFLEAKEKLLPPLFIVANSLSSDNTSTPDKISLTADFRELYFNSLTQMLRGINNNLMVYQAFLENSQIANATDPGGYFANKDTNQALQELAGIFLATESAELFSAQIGQYSNLTPSDETQRILGAIKNQQTTIINGIINFTNTGAITKEQARQAYDTIVRSITSPTILNILGNFAISVFGRDNVAFIQNELTSTQPNPNLVVMVIRENQNTYRSINIDNGRIVNRVSNDNRGLSAADILNQSNVNVIRIPQATTNNSATMTTGN